MNRAGNQSDYAAQTAPVKGKWPRREPANRTDARRSPGAAVPPAPGDRHRRSTSSSAERRDAQAPLDSPREEIATAEVSAAKWQQGCPSASGRLARACCWRTLADQIRLIKSASTSVVIFFRVKQT